MVFSRFWYLVLAVGVAAATFLLYLATGVSNRNEERTASKLLDANAVAVSFYLKDHAAARAERLVQLAFNKDIGELLKKAESATALKDIDAPIRDKANSALRKFREELNDPKFESVHMDALWAVDVHGRVVASENFEKGTGGEGFEMGGYPVVADALHGFIRDDTWMLGDEMWRVVARPVELEAGSAPVGAIVGGKRVDDRFARDVVKNTGAAVVFYALGKSIIKAAPVASDTHLVQLTPEDLAKLADDKDYIDGKSKMRLVRQDANYDLRGIYMRMPGEVWDLDGGFVVMHQQQRMTLPSEFYALATDAEKKAAPALWLALIALAAAFVGFVFSLLEHTMPLSSFKRALADLANKNSKTDVLKPSTFRGVYKQLAALVNDGLDKVASAAGIDRGPADLQRVLGPLPAEPQMSAFAIPDKPPAAASPVSSAPATPRTLPKADERSLPKAMPATPPVKRELPMEEEATNIIQRLPDIADVEAGATAEPPQPMVPKRQAPAAAPPVHQETLRSSGDTDEETEWRQVYADFLAMKKQLNEPVDKMSYEKFKGTLQRNKDALIARHGCTRVSFRVYEKEGRAALKASPVK